LEGRLTMIQKLTPTVGKVYGKERDRYLELVSLFPLRPIRTDAELDAAIRVIDMLIDQRRRSKAEDDYLDVLGDLVEAYEDVHVPIGPVSDADMLQSCLDDWRVTQAEVAKKTRIAESTISEVLSGKRKLNRAQIGKLARYFKIAPGAFAERTHRA
jgi:HTH-type transcriptional regulator/antitoxin HigA